MSVLFRDTMTVYNYHRDQSSGEEHWNRTVVRGVQWRHNRRELSTSHHEQSAARVESITVDFRRSYGNADYVPPNEYRAMTEEEASNFWTLDVSEGMDVLVLGISDYEIGKDCRLSELAGFFQYVATVRAVSDNRNTPRLKNIKVVAG